MFESFHGSYSDNPRAISERLHERRPDLRQVWAVRDRSVVPDWAQAVPPDGGAHLWALARARFLVANSEMPRSYRKPPGTTYLQTWHGTPVKRIAHDILRPSFRDSAKYLAALDREVASWDHLVSPNAFSTEVFRRAFRYDGPVLETGYPRNDLLQSPAADQIRRDVRRMFDVADGQRALLYAPTWRDDDRFTLELDVGRTLDALGEDHVLLLRAHHMVAATVTAQAHPRLRDASRYPDIRDLYLAADALLTDYSSAMFDFAVTRKPIVLFPYDLEHYRDDLRGLYVDLEAEAPGPVVRTTDEVVAAVQVLDAGHAAHAGRYRAFTDRYCPLDDGRAAERVIDAVFG
jgi:CDP-glycerol glycerophosphotransferase